MKYSVYPVRSFIYRNKHIRTNELRSVNVYSWMGEVVWVNLTYVTDKYRALWTR
jgi:hypothetical protein